MRDYYWNIKEIKQVKSKLWLDMTDEEKFNAIANPRNVEVMLNNELGNNRDKSLNYYRLLIDVSGIREELIDILMKAYRNLPLYYYSDIEGGINKLKTRVDSINPSNNFKCFLRILWGYIMRIDLFLMDYDFEFSNSCYENLLRIILSKEVSKSSTDKLREAWDRCNYKERDISEY